jgi:hypothetical protein
MQPPVYVHKNHKHGAYTSVPNQSMQNQSLSWAARGLLAYMLTMPGHWQLNEKDLIGRAPTGRDHLRSIVRELEAVGHLTRTPIRGQGGKILRMVWEVWDLPVTDCPSVVMPLTENPSVVEPVTDCPSTENPSVDRTQSLQPVSAIKRRNVHPTTDGLAVDGKPVQLEKNHLRNKQNLELIPPLTPQHAEPTEPPQAAAPTDTKPTRKQAFKPTQEDIPAHLLPVASDLLDFWQGKRGSKSLQAWKALLTQLAKIQNDVNGGTEVLRAQIQKGIQVGWQSITHENWQRFAKPALPFGNGNGTKPRSRVMPKAEFMAEFLQVHAQNTLRTI